MAGLGVGYPSEPGRITPPPLLGATVHVDRYDETGIREGIDAYDRRRHALLPYRKQRYADRYANVDFYGWSGDKARQCSVPEREGFNAFVRKQGFSLR